MENIQQYTFTLLRTKTHLKLFCGMNTTRILIAMAVILLAVIGSTGRSAKREACFDALSRAAVQQIKRAYFMNIREIIQERLPSDIYACFLRASSNGDESLDEKYFKTYNKLENLKDNDFELFDKRQLQGLVSSGLSYDHEKYLDTRLQTGDKKELQKALRHVQDELAKKIELSKVYKDFKKLISEKYNPGRYGTVLSSSAAKNCLPVLAEVSVLFVLLFNLLTFE